MSTSVFQDSGAVDTKSRLSTVHGTQDKRRRQRARASESRNQSANGSVIGWIEGDTVIASPPSPPNLDGAFTVATADRAFTKFITPFDGWLELDAFSRDLPEPKVIADKNTPRPLALVTFATYEGREQIYAPTGWRTGGCARNKTTIRSVTAVGLDFDKGDSSVDRIATRLTDLGLAGWIYTSYSHTIDYPKLRVILPLRKPFEVTGDGWKTYHAKYLAFGASFDAGTIDTACVDPTRLWYWPAKRADDAPFEQRWVSGRPLDLRDVGVPLIVADPAKQARASRSPRSMSMATKPKDGDVQSGVSLGEVEDLLGYISPDCDYGTWRDVVWAVHAEFSGTPQEAAARQLVDDWSKASSDDKYDAFVFERLWEGADAEGGVTIGTLFHHAAEGGFDQRKRDRAALDAFVATLNGVGGRS